MGKLTAAKVKSIASLGLRGDGGTLYLKVAPGGSKSWIQRLTVNGRRRDVGLGGFPLVTLAEARDKTFDNRRRARGSGDPLAEKRKAKVPTFREAALTVFEASKPGGKTGLFSAQAARAGRLTGSTVGGFVFERDAHGRQAVRERGAGGMPGKRVPQLPCTGRSRPDE